MTVKLVDTRAQLSLWRRWEPWDPESHVGFRNEVWRQQKIRSLEAQLRRETARGKAR